MQSLSKLFAGITMTAVILFTHTPALCAAHDTTTEQRIDRLERRVQLLEMEEIVYGPITVTNVRLGPAKQRVIVEPGQKIGCSFRYKIDSSQLELLNKTHLIVGLANVGAETCVKHTYGVLDSVGVAKFDLIAPLEPGEYEVRVASRSGDKCQDAFNTWTILGDEPSAFATIGIIQVQPIQP